MPQVSTGGSSAAVAHDERPVTHVEVSVAGGPRIQLCVDPAAGDAVASWFIDHGHRSIDEPVQRAFVGAVRPGDRVLDLGSHLGLFSLTAAALGASVLSVDANREHCRLLSLAADRNGFDDVHVAHVAIAGSDDVTSVSFIERSIHGHVLPDGAVDPSAVTVAARTVDALLDDLGWDGLDVVKMDIEGSEVAALRGMERLFGSGARPVLVFECNASMLAVQGWSVPALRTLLCDFGYELHLIDHLRPGVLVTAGPLDVQPESASDVIACVPGDRERIGASWRIEEPFDEVTLVTRIIDAANSSAPGYRRHSAELLRDGPAWLRDHPVASSTRRALLLDESADVRTAGTGPARSAGVDLVDAARPQVGPPDEPILVWAEDVVLRRRADEPRWRQIELPPETSAPEHQLVLRSLSLHVARGERLAVLCREREPGEHLLAALDGQGLVNSGRLLSRGTAVALIRAADALEPRMSIADNVVVLGAHLGGAVAALQGDTAGILADCGLQACADAPIEELAPSSLSELVAEVALSCVQADLLLLGDLPPVSPAAAERLAERARRWSGSGRAIVQVVATPASLVIGATRAAWIEDRSLVAAGHTESVLGAAELHRCGFLPEGRGWTTLPR